MKKKIILFLLICTLTVCAAAGTVSAYAAGNPDIYDFRTLFEYTSAEGVYADSTGIISNTDYYGAQSFQIRGTKTGAEANGSGAKFKTAFSGNVKFTMNAIPKAGAATASDYAFRKLTVRFADFEDETKYFDFVIHNYHSWVEAPSVFPNLPDPSAQGALSFVEYNGIRKTYAQDDSGPNVNLPFGGAMQGGFCGTTWVNANMIFEYRAETKEIWVDDGSGSGQTVARVDYDYFGDAAADFDPAYYTVEFIFDDVEEGQTPGIALAVLDSADYGALWTNNEGAKTSGSKPVIVSGGELGALGTFAPGTQITLTPSDNLLAFDFETGRYDVPLNDECVSLWYRQKDGTETVAIEGVTFASPAQEGDYEIVAAVTDKGGDVSDMKVIGTFSSGGDKEPPVVTLIGEGTLDVEVNGSVQDPGATATDAVSGECEVTSDFDEVVDFTVLGEYTVRYTAKDEAGNEGFTVRIVRVRDTQAPVITLNGESTVTLALGEAYTEQGATAADNYDKEVTVTAEGEVKVNIPGNYTVTYTAKDSSGNTATESRTVTVKDGAKPVISFENAITSGAVGETVVIAEAVVTDDSGESIKAVITVTDPDGNAVDVEVNRFVPDKTGTYTVTATATDSSGNTNTAFYEIEVGSGGCSGSVAAASAGAAIAVLSAAVFVAAVGKKRSGR